MGLTSTLFAGLSGLDVSQQKLNVVGNNIANVNTVAFKASRVLLKPQFYITDAPGSSPDGDFGGTNPSQRGLGATVAATEKNLAPGAIETTGRPSDLALDGNGFFVVTDRDGQKFTRDGSFKLNSVNQLVTTGGQYVQGYGVDSTFNLQTSSLQTLTVPLGAVTVAQATSKAKLAGNLDASGVVANGGSVLGTQLLTSVGGAAAPTSTSLLTDVAATSDPATAIFSVGQEFTLAGKKGAGSGRNLDTAKFTVTATSTLGDLSTFFQQGLGINTNVPDDGNVLTATPGVSLETDLTDPNSARLIVAGNLGLENKILLPAGSFTTTTGTSPLAFDATTNLAGVADNPSGESVRTSFTAFDSLGNPLTVGVTAVLDSTSSTGTTWRFYADSPQDTDADPTLGTGTIKFDNQGRLTNTTGASITIDRANTGARTPQAVTLDFSGMTALAARTSEMVMTTQDGSATGTLNSFSIGEDGLITGSFSNGLNRTLGQVAVAKFDNAQGLVDQGGNMYVAGPNSGAAVITTPGALGTARLISGSLELSNVDLSEEFVNMIIATTGFTAASRVITTSDQLLTELLNSQR